MGRTVRLPAFDSKKEARARRKDKFKASTKAERDFYKSLKKVAQASGHIVESHVDGASLIDERAMMEALRSYSKLITPWARKQSARLLEQVSRSNKRAYRNQSQMMGKALKTQVANSEVGGVAARLLLEQVALISSLPLEAGERAQKIAHENFLNGTRAQVDETMVAQLKREMDMSTEVAVNRAKLIARTETARANAAFVQARAKAVGSKQYVWRTTMDGAERESHAEMNGKIIDYDKPPTLSDGMTGHAGTFPNCRCYQDPVLPDYPE